MVEELKEILERKAKNTSNASNTEPYSSSRSLGYFL